MKVLRVERIKVRCACKFGYTGVVNQSIDLAPFFEGSLRQRATVLIVGDVPLCQQRIAACGDTFLYYIACFLFTAAVVRQNTRPLICQLLLRTPLQCRYLCR